MPRWRNCTCACVQASVRVRSKVLRVAVFVGKVQNFFARGGHNRGKNQMPVLPGGTCTVRRRLIIGSSTEPTVLESGLPSITEMGFRRLRARPMNRARSVSYCSSPTDSPSTTSTWAAQTEVSSSERFRRVASSAPDLGNKFRLDE